MTCYPCTQTRCTQLCNCEHLVWVQGFVNCGEEHAGRVLGGSSTRPSRRTFLSTGVDGSGGPGLGAGG